MPKTEELDTTGPGGAIAEVGPVTAALMGHGDFPEMDGEAISARIFQEMLKAETPEQLNAVGSTTPLETLLGVPLEVREVAPRPAQLDTAGGLVGYVVAAATRLDNGEDVIFSTSAYNVAMRLAIAADKGFVPGYRFKVVKSEKPTEQGFYPLLVQNV